MKNQVQLIHVDRLSAGGFRELQALSDVIVAGVYPAGTLLAGVDQIGRTTADRTEAN
jgi:hypothetical protein